MGGFFLQNFSQKLNLTYLLHAAQVTNIFSKKLVNAESFPVIKEGFAAFKVGLGKAPICEKGCVIFSGNFFRRLDFLIGQSWICNFSNGQRVESIEEIAAH